MVFSTMNPLHSLFARICSATVLGTCVLLSAHSAPDRATVQEDVKKLQDQVHALDKDVGVFNTKLDAQDKRIQDMQSVTSSQANHIGMVANQTTTLGNYIAWTSGVVSLLSILVGIFSFKMRDRAIQEAQAASRTVAEAWFEEKTKTLEEKIQALEAKASAYLAKIRDLEHLVSEAAIDAHKNINDAVEKITQKLTSLDVADANNSSILPSQELMALAVSAIKFKQKPEAEFTSDDYLARGLDEFSNKNFQAALASVEASLLRLAPTASLEKEFTLWLLKASCFDKLNKPEDAIKAYDLIADIHRKNPSQSRLPVVVQSLFKKGMVYQSQLNDRAEAIKIFTQLDKDYGQDADQSIRKIVAKGLVYKGLQHSIQQGESAQAIHALDLVETRYSQDHDPVFRRNVAAALVGKCLLLEVLTLYEDAIKVCELVLDRYSTDTSPLIHSFVVTTWEHKGLNNLMLGKKHWDDSAQSQQFLEEAKSCFQQALNQCGANDRVKILGCLGYSTFLQGDVALSEVQTRESLQLAGEKTSTRQSYLTQYRLDPQDTDYEALVTRLWDELNGDNSGSVSA